MCPAPLFLTHSGESLCLLPLPQTLPAPQETAITLTWFLLVPLEISLQTKVMYAHETVHDTQLWLVLDK